MTNMSTGGNQVHLVMRFEGVFPTLATSSTLTAEQPTPGLLFPEALSTKQNGL